MTAAEPRQHDDPARALFRVRPPPRRPRRRAVEPGRVGAWGPTSLYPNPTLTPGATTQATSATICSQQWSTTTIRPPTSFGSSTTRRRS
jgi:hypothetical protein